MCIRDRWIIATIIPIIVPIIKTLGAVFTDIFVGIIGVINSVIQILSGLIDFITVSYTHLDVYKRQEQGKQIEAMKPSKVFADAVATSKTSILIGELARCV